MITEITNVKTPPAATGEAFGFVFQTKPHSLQRNAADDFIHDDSTLV